MLFGNVRTTGFECADLDNDHTGSPTQGISEAAALSDKYWQPGE